GRVEQYVERPAEDASGVKGAMEGLRQREQLHRDADGKATVAERDRERAQSELERVGRQIDALLSKLGLTEDRADMLGRWLEELPRFQEVKQHLGEARTRRDTIAADIGEGHPALTHDRARIESDSDAARREAEGLSQLEREIGAIQNRIDGAKAGHHVEDARRGLDEAQAALERALGTAEQQAAGHAVIDWLREEATDRTQPAVLRRASELFQRITHGRYELRVEESPDGPTFAARDTQHEMVKSLDQLAAGERVQLLVSVRLGFLEQEESGVRLPLILDETLGTTDDARAGAIIDAVVEICRAERQVFYFTAQPDEVGKWRARLDGEAGIDLKVVDLARVRGLAESDGAPLAIDRPVESPVPSPAGDSHEAYGQRLDVPGLDPRRPVGGVHLWHLLDEPDLVYALITRSIRCWGPFESLVASGLIDVDGLDERRIAVTNARAVAIEAAFDAWRIGRGQAVARDVLEASGAVTSTFIDRIADLAASVGGDAREVIDALDRGEVSRWRSSGTETLREYLEEHGYLDEERRLLPEEILHRVLEQVALEHRGVDIGDDWVKRLVDGLPS
ncbi:MAG: ATP-binding protein, partial [Planctomycetota bacterium]